MTEDCIFCKIIKGEIPCSKIYEDDNVIALLDLFPVNKGHALVIPKKHSSDMLNDDDEDLKACIHTVKKVAPAIMKAMGADGFNLSVNTKPAAGQVVMHTHFHIIPRFDDDGLKHWPSGKYEEDEMDQVKDKIIENI